MQAQEMLTATHKLEESGMTQPQAEAIASTIAGAIEPLATKNELPCQVCAGSLSSRQSDSATAWYSSILE